MATITGSNVVLSNQEFNVVGTRPIRQDGAEKVTGRARYGADINLPGLLHARVLRSPHAHARIKSINTGKAEAMEGVRGVVTSADLPQPQGRISDQTEASMVNPKFLSNNCLAAEGKVLYKGHAVAAVAAVSPHIAEKALELIEVEYEVLDSVTDVLDAMKPDAPILHERLASVANPNMRTGGLRDEDDSPDSTNVANHFFFEMGDTDQGFKDADIVVEREFRTQSVHQGYIEPHSATVNWGPDGDITVWSSSQGHFNVRDQVALVCDVPISRIKAIPMEIGGGFGGKTLVYLEPVAAILSLKTGHPVKLSMSRSEVFQGSGPTSGSWMRCKVGATNEGRITAVDASMAYEAGAYPGSPINPGVQCMTGPYDIANGRLEGFDVVLNKPKTAAYRAPGAPAAAFAIETVLDEICEKIGMDPLEFRLLNGSKEGTRRLTGPVVRQNWQHRNPPGGQRPRALGVRRWKRPQAKARTGAAAWPPVTGSTPAGPSSAVASVNADGTVASH